VQIWGQTKLKAVTNTNRYKRIQTIILSIIEIIDNKQYSHWYCMQNPNNQLYIHVWRQAATAAQILTSDSFMISQLNFKTFSRPRHNFGTFQSPETQSLISGLFRPAVILSHTINLVESLVIMNSANFSLTYAISWHIKTYLVTPLLLFKHS